MTDPTPPQPATPDVTITDAALAVIAREAQQSRDGLETGGILLGHDFGKRIEIRHAGDPGSNAERGTQTFMRDLAHARTLAESAWERDRSQWIGEWHTHPNLSLVPSPRDLNSYLKHLIDPGLDFDRFISIIVGEAAGSTKAITWLIDTTQAAPIPIRRQT